MERRCLRNITSPVLPEEKQKARSAAHDEMVTWPSLIPTEQFQQVSQVEPGTEHCVLQGLLKEFLLSFL